MDNTIYEYIKNGITIEGNPIDGYKVFTIPTQWFHIDSLHQLTPQVFEEMIEEQKQRDELTSEMFKEIFKEVQNEIDQDILNQLRGGEPNPDIIPMNTSDRLYKNYGIQFNEIPNWGEFSKQDYDTQKMWGKIVSIPGIDGGYPWTEKYTTEEFTNKLLFDDDFYQKWGKDCCEELTYEERYKLWFSNNFETGMEYNPEIEPDFDNDYYEPTQKRKLK